MQYYRFPDKRITHVGFALLMMVLLLLARDTMITHCVVGIYVSLAVTLAVLGLFGVVFLIYNRRDIKNTLLDKRMILLLIVTVVHLLPMFAKRDWQLMYITVLLGSYVAIFMSYFASAREIAKYYVVLMSIFAVYSLLAHSVLRDIADAGIIQPQIFNNAGSRDYYNLWFAFPTVSELRERDFGMFREPGVYQYFLILALYLNNWRVEWKKEWKLWAINLILAVSTLGTQSTNGVVELVLLAGILFFDKKMYKNKVILGVFVSAVLAVLGVMIYSIASKSLLYGYLGAVFSKLFTQSDSLTARTASIFANLELFVAHPLFGEKIPVVLHAIPHNTSSTLIMFAAFGVACGLLHIVGWIALVWDKSRHVLWNLGLVATMFMTFNTQNLTWDILFWLFPMMALTERVVPWLERKTAK